MEFNIFRDCVLNHLADYKLSKLGIDEKGIWKQNSKQYPHILPERLKALNILPTAKMPENFKEHGDSHHLNSSQMMCINFFEPLLNDDEGRKLLLEIFAQVLKIKIDFSANIIKKEFEYTIPEKEKTNFDFYLELSTGEKFYFEIKYTESAFGKTKYKGTWDNIYVPHLKESMYLKDISKDDFYDHFQIWRNVAYIKSEKDYSVIIFMYLNCNLKTEIKQTIGLGDNKKYKNAFALYWHSVISAALSLTRNTKYSQHFNLFNEKYLKYDISDGEDYYELIENHPKTLLSEYLD